MTVTPGVTMSEKQLQDAVVECARLLGWLVYHTHDSRHSAAGFPDLCMARDGHLIFAELKTSKGRVDAILHVSIGVNRVQSYLWRPEHWMDGTVEQALRQMPTFDARHEREFVCTDCGDPIIVGGYTDDIDPFTYRGVVCGCRRQKPREQADQLAAAIERAKAAQTGRGIPYMPEVA